MDTTFYPALFRLIDHVSLALIGAGVLFGLVLRYPAEMRSFLSRIREAGPDGVKLDPAINEVDAMKKQLEELRGQLLAKAPQAQIAGRIAQVQASLQSVSNIVGTLNASEESDTTSSPGVSG